MTTEVGREQCPSCLSQGRDTAADNLVRYDDGGATCFACDYYELSPAKQAEQQGPRPTVQEIKGWPLGLPLTARGISAKAAEFYGVRVLRHSDQDFAYAYPLPQQDYKIGGYQIRKLPKEFMRRGQTKGSALFGQDKVGDSGQMLIVAEGQDDTLAAFDLLDQCGKSYKVVGSLGTTHWKKNLEWLMGFDKVMIAFDQDEAGQEAAQELAEALNPGQGRIVRWNGAKDINELLNEGRPHDFLRAIGDAKAVQPDGIVSGSDSWERLMNRPIVQSIPYPEHWVTMNEMTKGIRLGELDTWTSGSGMGKTQVLRELQYHLMLNADPSHNIGIIALEEPVEDSVEALMSLHINQRIHLNEDSNKRHETWYRQAWEATMGTGRFHFYDHFGSLRDDKLMSKIRYLAKGLDCRYIFLDHLSIVVSEYADEGAERQIIDSLMSRLKNLTQELGIWIGLVVHLRKSANASSPFEQGGVPSLDDLRGSGSIKQLSNGVYALSRNQQAGSILERNTSQLHSLKCRYTGSTGQADRLFYDAQTGRMVSPQQATEDVNDAPEGHWTDDPDDLDG